MVTKDTVAVVIALAVDADAQHEDFIRQHARKMLTIEQALEAEE